MRPTRRPTRRLARRLTITAAAAALPVLLVAGAASAHVTVSAPGATQGGDATITFSVPNEMDNAVTTKVQVYFPRSQPLADVSIKPTPGWSYHVTTVHLTTPITSDDGQVSQVVSVVTWRADSKATAIRPGEFNEFTISAGPMPDSPTMVFKALQTYSDGTIVRWIDPTPPGGAEPAHPAPTLTLASATGTTGEATTGPATPSTSSSTSGDGRATTALVLSIVAVLVAAGAAVATFVRRSGS